METFITILAIFGFVIILISALPEPDETDESIDDFNNFCDTINKKGE